MAAPNSWEAGNQRQIPMQHANTAEVLVETPDIVTFFVANQLQARGHVLPQEIQIPNVNTEVASCLRQVGDELENNHSLNSLIGQIKVTRQTAFDTFADVAKQIFADGVYNWGRIASLLYFGFKLACSVISQVPLFKLVLDWVVRFVREQLVDWIAQQGGWGAIKNYVSSGVDVLKVASNTQVAAVFLLGVACFLWTWGKN